MNESLFISYVKDFFAPIVQSIITLINGKPEAETLLNKTMLTEEYSADLKWGSKQINKSIVAADVVSMDSSLPLKKRDSIQSAQGEIVKIGMKLKKGERAIKNIQIMEASGATQDQIVSAIFDDVPKCIAGMDVRKEIMFEQALSTGYALIQDADNSSIGIRVNYGYKDDNQLYPSVVWGADEADYDANLEEMFSKIEADGRTAPYVYLSKKYFNYYKNSTQGKALAASFNNLNYSDTSTLPTPSKATFLAALEDAYGAKFTIIDKSFITEKNGVQTSIKPWKEDAVVFTYSNIVGRMVYGTCAEVMNPVAGVEYQAATQGTLISKYSKNDPLIEFTSAQALALPVIDGVEGIYILHAGSTSAE